MKKTFALILGFSSIVSVTAVAARTELPAYVNKCADTGMRKLREQAKARELDLDPNTFTSCGVDNRWYNPSKYAWYCANAYNFQGTPERISVIVQYARRKCF